MRTILALLLFCQLAHAQFIVQSFTGGLPESVGPGVGGVGFTVTAAVPSLQSVGVFDSNGGAGLFNSHEVGIWNATTHALLADVTVPAGTAGTFLNGAWYVNLAAPLALPVGQSFVIGAFYKDNDFDFAFGNATSVTTAPGIMLGDALLSSASTFSYPDLNVSGANFGFFGADASFQAVPEPGAWGLVAGVLLLAFSLLRSHGGVIEETLAKTKRPELAAEATRIVRANPSARPTVLRWIASHRPASLIVVERTIAENRPPVTPGNDHGQRPTVPPGQRYATP